MCTEQVVRSLIGSQIKNFSTIHELHNKVEYMHYLIAPPQNDHAATAQQIEYMHYLIAPPPNNHAATALSPLGATRLKIE